MASGDTLVSFTALNAVLPVSNFPQFDMRNDFPVLDFDAAATEYASFVATVPRHYTGNGFTVTIGWAASTATSGDVRWTVGFARIEPNVQDLDTVGFPINIDEVSTAPSVSGQVQTATAVVAPVFMQDIAPGDLFQLRIWRIGTDPADTMSGDAELVFVEVRET